jgi:hypothetical protein
MIIGSCGCELSKYGFGNQIHIVGEDFEGDKYLESMTVCDNCLKLYVKEDNVYLSYEEALKDFNKKDLQTFN